jgi:translocator protein
MIAYYGWLVWDAGFMIGFAIWLAQLGFNALWSFLFSGKRQMRLAMMDLGIMLALILVYISLTLSVIPMAAWLFVPYAMWVCIAGALNMKMIQLNPSSTQTL